MGVVCMRIRYQMEIKAPILLFKNYRNLKLNFPIKQILLYSLAAMMLILTGATSGWILVNSEKTATQRSELMPELKVDVLGEEEGATKKH
jgi:hypothetical protein